ncbi:MAG: HepT-like ribonuclease domain-containing protein [Candidatus Competibacteraceae bacterium]
MKDDLVYIGHMHDTALKAWQKIDGKTRSDYDANEDLMLALAHLVQIIGEAARRVSEETQRKHPDIPWTEIIGMRHKIVHDYMNVDEDVLWEVVTQDLEPLIAALNRILSAKGFFRGDSQG